MMNADTKKYFSGLIGGFGAKAGLKKTCMLLKNITFIIIKTMSAPFYAPKHFCAYTKPEILL